MQVSINTATWFKRLQLRFHIRRAQIRLQLPLPGAIFIIDPTKEKIALAEAQKVGVPVVATVDTNCNPDGIDYIIPANDDAIKAIRVICTYIANAVLEGKMLAEAGEKKETEAEAEVAGSGEPAETATA